MHALNTLRMLFSASELADGTARLLPQGVGACLAGLSASRWEIRNAATLAYAALLTRVLGFRNDAVQVCYPSHAAKTVLRDVCGEKVQ